MRKYKCHFYVFDDGDSIEFWSDRRAGSKANRADALQEIRAKRGRYIWKHAEITNIERDLTD